MTTTKVVSFSEQDLKEFKRMYEVNNSAEQTVFIFKGEAYNIHYAKYVIEYLEDKFKAKA